jgi:hypothetical protein
MSRDRTPEQKQFSASFFGALAVVSGFLIIALALLGSYFVTQSDIAANMRAQQAAAAMSEQHLCTTLNALKALQPPPGNPKTNPSRAFDVEQHDVLAQLAADLGCPAIPVQK